MPIHLPNMAAHNCIALSVCGHVQATDPKTLRLLKRIGDGWRIARVRSKAETAFVRSRIGSPIPEHVHLEIVLRKEFASPPKTNATLKAIIADFEPLMGQQVFVAVEATFALPAKRLPPFIRSRLVNIETPSGVSITSRSGRLAVDGGPLYMITWSLRGEGEATVLLEATYDLQISDHYLAELLVFMETTFKAIILGEGADERP